MKTLVAAVVLAATTAFAGEPAKTETKAPAAEQKAPAAEQKAPEKKADSKGAEATKEAPKTAQDSK